MVGTRGYSYGQHADMYGLYRLKPKYTPSIIQTHIHTDTNSFTSSWAPQAPATASQSSLPLRK